MKELKVPIIIYSCVGIALCLTFSLILKIFEKNHPNLFSIYATKKEKLRYGQIVKASINTVLLYAIFAILGLTMITYEKPPIAVLIMCGFFILFAIANLITIFKKK